MADLHSLPITSQTSEFIEQDLSADQKILLVCIINYKRINITFDFLYNLFSPYGDVKKILFFEKTLTWKAFVEMGSAAQANKAKNSLNNMSLFNDGSKVNLYLSNLKELVLPKNMMNGKDYSKPQEPGSLAEISEMDKFTNAFQSFSLQEIRLMDETGFNMKRNFFEEDRKNSIDSNSLAAIQENDENLLYKKTHTRERSIDEMIKNNNKCSNNFFFPEPPGLSRSINYQKQKGVLKSAELSKRNSTGAPSPFLNTASLATSVSLKSPQIPSVNSFNNLNLSSSPNNGTTQNDIRIGSASNFNVFAGEASKVLFIKGLEDQRLKVQIIYNLFSNFGNITKIIFMRNKSGALIEFQSIEYATIAKDFLNNLNFFSNYLRISYSNYQEIVLKNVNFGALKEDILICDENLMRFKKNKNILINPPSNVIHLSNLSKEACDEDKIREFLADFGSIEKIKFLIQDNQKNMCLVKFSKLEESLLAISLKHNCELEGRAVKISFTKTKI